MPSIFRGMETWDHIKGRKSFFNDDVFCGVIDWSANGVPKLFYEWNPVCGDYDRETQRFSALDWSNEGLPT